LSRCGPGAAMGGVVFALLVRRPALRERSELSPILGRLLALIALGGLAVIVGQVSTLGVQQVVLAEENGWPLREILTTAYFEASVWRILACVALIVCA